MEVLKNLADFLLHSDKHLSAIISHYHAMTYLILFLIIFAETGFVVTPFLPGDSLLFAAGALIAADNTGLSIVLLALLLLLAAFSGNTVNYLLGSFLGARVFQPGNRVLKPEYYLRTKAFFDRHGGKAVIFSRFVPIVRTIAPFVAGVGRMPFLRYSLYNLAGGFGWIMLFLFTGYWLGNVPFLKTHFSLITILIVASSLVPPIIAAIKSRFAEDKPAA